MAAMMATETIHKSSRFSDKALIFILDVKYGNYEKDREKFRNLLRTTIRHYNVSSNDSNVYNL